MEDTLDTGKWGDDSTELGKDTDSGDSGFAILAKETRTQTE